MALAGQVDNLEKLSTQELHYPGDGGAPIEAYLAQPKEPGRYPGVIVVHEAFGLIEHEKDVARRLANVGFIALAPNLFSRVGNPDAKDFQGSVFPKMFGLDDRVIVRDLEAAAAQIRQQTHSNDKVGVIGFCMGGRAALLCGCSSKQVDAVVDCWGGFVHRATADAATTPTRPTAVLDLLGNLNCPLYAVSGAEDQNPSPEITGDIQQRLERLGKGKLVETEVFPGAGHAFFADYRPGYNEKAAFALWPKIVSFFREKLR